MKASFAINLKDQTIPIATDKKIALWIIALICFGYPVQAMFPVLFSMDSTVWNLSIRLIYAVCLFLIICRHIRPLYKISLPILLFWFLYSFRLIYDLSVRGVKFGGGDTFYVYSFAFGSTFLSILACIFCLKLIPLEYINKVFRQIITLSCISILFLVIYQNNGIDQALFTKRLSILGKDEDLLTINTLWIGFFGCCLAVISLFRLAFVRLNSTGIIFTILLLIIGIIELFLGAARSPFITFILLGLIITIMTFYRFFRSKGRHAGRFILMLSIFCIAIFSFVKLSEQVDFAIVDRLINFNESRQVGDKEERDFEWQSAWNQFLDNPILGDQFVTKYDDYYPHNIHIEVLMALGIIGGCVYLTIYFQVFSKIFKAFKVQDNEKMFLAFLFFCSLFFASTSGSLWADATIWCLIIIISGII